MRRIRNKRFYAWPPVYVEGERLRLRAKFFTPKGFLVIENVVLEPLKVVWGFALILLIVDWALLMSVGVNGCFRMPFEQRNLLLGLGISAVLWKLELRSNYRFLGFFFRRVLVIELNGERMKIGGRWRRRSIHMDYPMSFAIQGFRHTNDRIYQVAQKFELIIDQTRRIRLASLIDGEEAEQLVSNANLMLAFHDDRDDHQVDIDQTQEALRRALGSPGKN